MYLVTEDKDQDSIMRSMSSGLLKDDIKYCHQILWKWIGKSFKFFSQILSIHQMFWASTRLVEYLPELQPQTQYVTCNNWKMVVLLKLESTVISTMLFVTKHPKSAITNRNREAITEQLHCNWYTVHSFPKLLLIYVTGYPALSSATAIFCSLCNFTAFILVKEYTYLPSIITQAWSLFIYICDGVIHVLHACTEMRTVSGCHVYTTNICNLPPCCTFLFKDPH